MAPRLVLLASATRDPFLPDLVRLLRSRGGEVLLAHDAETTARLARLRRPAAIVLDTVLQDGDGIRLCRRLKATADTRRIPVFFFSVLMARDRSMEAGAEGFMLKPVEQELLLGQLLQLLGLADPRLRRFPVSPRS